MAEHVADPTPSTNEANEADGWAHFDVVEVRVGEVEIDDEPTAAANFNTAIHDGLWDFVCVNNTTIRQTIVADTHVDIRMVFGAEADERFDWTRVDVLAPLAKDDCKSGGYEAEGFSNQGRCVASVQANQRAGFGPDAPPRGRH
jgi:hypothetical protein